MSMLSCCPVQALTMGEKESLALYATSPAMYGYLINNWLQRHGWRVSLHKFAKEALCCTDALWFSALVKSLPL